MPFSRPNLSSILAYTIIGLIFSSTVFVVLSISTNHWIHTGRIRAGLWKLCYVRIEQPLQCINSIQRSPAALSLTGLCLIVIGFFSTWIFNILDCHLPASVRYVSLVSVASLLFGSFFLTMSHVAFSRLITQFGYSFYLMIIGQIFAMIAAILAGYLQGQRDSFVSSSIITNRMQIRKT